MSREELYAPIDSVVLPEVIVEEPASEAVAVLQPESLPPAPEQIVPPANLPVAEKQKGKRPILMYCAIAFGLLVVYELGRGSVKEVPLAPQEVVEPTESPVTTPTPRRPPPIPITNPEHPNYKPASDTLSALPPERFIQRTVDSSANRNQSAQQQRPMTRGEQVLAEVERKRAEARTQGAVIPVRQTVGTSSPSLEFNPLNLTPLVPKASPAVSLPKIPHVDFRCDCGGH